MFNPNAYISFSDYDDPVDGILSSENTDKEVETKRSWSLGSLRI